MDNFTTDGLVIKSSVTGESDFVVWVLTPERGIIRAFAKGARGIKSKLHNAASLFAYCAFTFSEKNEVFHITEAQIKEMFFGLRSSFETVSLAQYFCEIMLKTVDTPQSDPLMLRLMLNSLHFLCTGEKPQELVKAVFELECASLCGYAPSLIACDECGRYESEIMYFDFSSGLLYCDSCASGRSCYALPLAVVSAMRHIVFSDFGKIFSFSLTDEALKLLQTVTGKYLAASMQLNLKTAKYL